MCCRLHSRLQALCQDMLTLMKPASDIVAAVSLKGLQQPTKTMGEPRLARAASCAKSKVTGRTSSAVPNLKTMGTSQGPRGKP